jgi:hypothetical protein
MGNRLRRNVATTFWYLIDQFLEAVSNAYRRATAELVRARSSTAASPS